ncbi:MAG: PfkB family carbohydrate kinase [Lachnospiraceae bacterium]
MKDRVITLGEILLRLSPDNNERFTQCHSFEAVYGGGEANTAVSLANFGVDSSYVTKLPAHAIGQSAVNSLRAYGVDTSNIVRGGSQIGIYFLEKKTSQRPTNVIYNRKGSAIALAEETDFDWDVIFEGATWFHFSGITPALSDNMAKITLTACKKAKEKGLTISCDLNYRSKLWSGEKAEEVMNEICPYVDICIANEDDAVGIFGMNADHTDEEKNAYIAKELTKKFPFKMVASVWRTETSITTFKLQSMIYMDGKAYYSKEYYMNILDYIGAGDAYCAGIIYSVINHFEPQKMVEFANAASCLKHTVSGDYNLVTVDEVMRLAFGTAGNEVQR